MPVQINPQKILYESKIWAMGGEGRMSLDRQREVDNLYHKAQRILLHELTQDEQLMVAELGVENHATLSDDKLNRLKALVRMKGHKQSASS